MEVNSTALVHYKQNCPVDGTSLLLVRQNPWLLIEYYSRLPYVEMNQSNVVERVYLIS